jgi:Ca-activated chloride channel family protein
MIDFITNYTSGDMSHFHFMRPLWLFAIFPLLGFHYVMKKQQDVVAQWQSVMSKNIIEHLTLNRVHSIKVTPLNLFLVFSILATLVMAGPTWKQQPSPFFEDNSELIIALDVAGSMKTTDLQPSRLERAKQKVSQLIDLRGDSKTGLVVYGGSAHVAMPVTKDRELIRYFLDVLDEDLLPDTSSKPKSSIQPISQLLAKTKVPSTVVILTDKTDQEAIDAFEAKFRDLQHQVIVWAIAENEGSGSNASGGLTDSDITGLANLAKAGNGNLVTFTHNADDVEQVMDLIENNLFAVTDKAQPWQDAGYLLLFLLLPIQLMWFRRGWTLQW